MDNRDHRIIFINTYDTFAYNILCEVRDIDFKFKIITYCQAYHRAMFGPKYVWITHTWFNSHWWTAIKNTRCVDSEILQVLNGSIGIVPYGLFLDDNETAISISGEVGHIIDEQL